MVSAEAEPQKPANATPTPRQGHAPRENATPTPRALPPERHAASEHAAPTEIQEFHLRSSAYALVSSKFSPTSTTSAPILLTLPDTLAQHRSQHIATPPQHLSVSKDEHERRVSTDPLTPRRTLHVLLCRCDIYIYIYICIYAIYIYIYIYI